MAGRARKRDRERNGPGSEKPTRRQRSGSQDKQHSTPYERKRQAMEQEEIDSDLESTSLGEEDTRMEKLVAARDASTNELFRDDPNAVGHRVEGSVQELLVRDDPSETVEQKRLRLAREYLKNIGIDPDAVADPSEDDDIDADDAAADSKSYGPGSAIARLQRDAALADGRTITKIAKSIAEKYSIQSGTDVPVTRTVRAHDVAPTCVAISSDETHGATGGKDSRVLYWDIETGKKLLNLGCPVHEPQYRNNPGTAPGHVGHVRAIAIAHAQGGNIVASGGDDGLVRLWDVRSGKQVQAMRGHRGPINALAFRSGTMQLYSGSQDRTVKIWDVNDMAYVETLFGHGAEVCAVDSLVKERAISVGRDGSMRLYKVLDGSQLVFRRARTSSLDCVAMVNEQRFVSGGDDGSVSLWQVNKKRPVASVEHAHGEGTGCDMWVSAVAAGRNTDLVFSGAGDGFVRLWMCEDRPPALSPVSRVNVGSGFVNGLAFGSTFRVLLAVVGQEPRLGRWERKRGVKAGLRVVVFPQN